MLDTNAVAYNSSMSIPHSFESIFPIAAGTIILRCNSCVIPLLKILSGFPLNTLAFPKKYSRQSFYENFFLEKENAVLNRVQQVVWVLFLLCFTFYYRTYK